MSQSIWLTQNIGDNKTFNLPTLRGKETVNQKNFLLKFLLNARLNKK